MPALISYNTKRGIIFYTPPNSPSTDPETLRFSSPPCRPRTRRPHSIHIIRLPSPTTPYLGKHPCKRIDLKSIISCQNAKRLLTSALASLSPKESVETPQPIFSHSEDSGRLGNHRSRQSRLATARSLSGESHRTSRRIWSKPIFSGSIMSRSSIGGNSWRPIFSIDPPNSANSTGSDNPRSETTGIPYLLTSQRNMYDLEKPLVSGNEISCSIILAEPVIFLMGLDHDTTTRGSNGGNGMALLRGTLRLNVTKNAKIKAVNLKFSGKAKTLWPEGIPPQKQETVEECSLKTQIIPFFNAHHKGSESSYGDLCNYTLRDSKPTLSSTSNLAPESLKHAQQGGFSLSGITGRTGRYNTVSLVSEGRRLSVPSIQLKSQQRAESAQNSAQSKSYKVFYPGVYDYSFELPIDSNMPETTNLPLASVKWELEATIERAGTFKAKLVGRKEVPVVRSPSQDSLELVEPIAVSRTWDQQLHYDIVISGKSFPIGSKIPIAFKLTPLAKVQVHKVKVFLTEKVEYFARDRSVHRKDIKRRLLLLEKSAGKPVAKEFWPSEVKILGGEPTKEEREMRRSVAMRRREVEAQRNNTHPVPLPECAENLLGDIDLGVEEWWGPTEIEMNVQLPTCETMGRDGTKRLAHDCTWTNVHVYHWLKILIRLSRADTDDPTKRRHYEISVDSPISLLNCRASQANISLPEYSGLNPDTQGAQQVCGCPNAAQVNGTSVSQMSNEFGSLIHQSASEISLPGLSRPAQAHMQTEILAGARRPMHLMRSPSFQPPPFDAEDPPPPITTPPPLYDNVIGTPSHDGLADYFMRLGEYEGEITEDEDPVCSVNRSCMSVPNSYTNSGRHARIMDMNHEFIFGRVRANNIMAGTNSGVSTL